MALSAKQQQAVLDALPPLAPCALCEQPDSWQKGHFAAAHLIPKSTGSYFVIVAVESSPEERTHWALVYGFR